MKNSNEFASMWRQKIEATVSKEFGGLPGQFRRLNLLEWIRLGKLPQFLVDKMLDASGRSVASFAEADFAPDELKQVLEIRRQVVCAVAVEPKIVDEDRELKDGEVSYRELAEHCPEVVMEIASWVFSGCPGVPVKTKDGEVDLAEVESFRNGREDGPTTSPGSDVQAVSPEAELVSGN
jgi:hypothetical protein